MVDDAFENCDITKTGKLLPIVSWRGLVLFMLTVVWMNNLTPKNSAYIQLHAQWLQDLLVEAI